MTDARSTADAVDPIAAIVAAVKANDAASVARLLERHAELKARIDEAMPGLPFGATLLHGAVHHRNREMVDILLRAGADINVKSHWWAGGFGVLDDDHGLTDFLIERGAVVDPYAASRLGMLGRLAELISGDPGLVHTRGGDGQTPLHVAPTADVARYLLEHGADIDARDVDHESTPAQYMVRDRQEVARYLVARGCTTDILMAAALGDLDLVRKHLDADPALINVRVSDKHFPKRDPRSGGTIYIWALGAHRTPHAVAREFGHSEVVRLLMDRSPVEVRLAELCESGDETSCRELLASAPDAVKSLSEDVARRIAEAAEDNNTDGVRLMLAAGWPVDVRGRHGGTPLHWAAWNGNAEMVREILRHRPSLELRDDDHDLPALGWALHGSVHGWHCASGDYGATVGALLSAGSEAPPLAHEVDASDAAREALRRHAERR